MSLPHQDLARTAADGLDEAPAREAICRTGASLHARGYAHATAGNISVRLSGGQGWLITPTDACLGTLEPQHLAHIAPDGRQLSGERASKTLALHQRIYEADPQAACVLHTHSSHLVALTLAGAWQPDDILPPLTPYQLMKVGHVPLVPYHRPGDPAVADWVARRIQSARAAQRALHAVMLDRLGPTVWHVGLEQASTVLEELEETAKVWLLSGRQATALDETQIETLRRESRALW